MSKSTMSFAFLSIANESGVRRKPLFLVITALMLAFLAKSILHASSCLWTTARCNAVVPSGKAQFTFAPLSSNHLRTSVCPCIAASKSGVAPSDILTSTVPFPISSLRVSKSPLLAALKIAPTDFESSSLASAIRGRIVANITVVNPVRSIETLWLLI